MGPSGLTCSLPLFLFLIPVSAFSIVALLQTSVDQLTLNSTSCIYTPPKTIKYSILHSHFLTQISSPISLKDLMHSEDTTYHWPSQSPVSFCISHISFLIIPSSLLFYPEDGGNMLLQDADSSLPDYSALFRKTVNNIETESKYRKG